MASGRDLGDLEKKGKDYHRKEKAAREIATEMNQMETAVLLERFMANPLQIRLEIREKLGLKGISSFQLIFMIWQSFAIFL